MISLNINIVLKYLVLYNKIKVCVPTTNVRKFKSL